MKTALLAALLACASAAPVLAGSSPEPPRTDRRPLAQQGHPSRPSSGQARRRCASKGRREVARWRSAMLTRV